jgi:hypothetical protein
MFAERGMPGERNDGIAWDLRMATVHLEQRRELRYPVPIEIEVSGSDQRGEVFHERTFTRNVSEWGCGFVTCVELKPDDIVAVRVASRDAGESAEARQSLFQVRRVSREENGWLVGAWKMDSGNVWGADLEKMAEPQEDKLESRTGESARSGEQQRKDADP